MVAVTAWTEAKADRMIELYIDGMSTAAIGRAIGMSKNAVISKCHRVGLPARPSPIKGHATHAPRPTPQARQRAAQAVTAVRGDVVVVRLRAPAVTVFPMGALGSARTCQWIEGPAQGAHTAFCGHASAPGRSWCTTHTALVFPRPGAMREAAE